jgi:hypothetical protein
LFVVFFLTERSFKPTLHTSLLSVGSGSGRLLISQRLAAQSVAYRIE